MYTDLWGWDTQKKNGALFKFKADTKSDPSNLILLELQRVLRSEVQEMRWAKLKSDECSEKEKSRRLLHLFQCDLLPGLSGEIFASKSARDSVAARSSVSLHSKILFYAVIVIVNAAMLLYILLFAIQQTKYRQRAWFQSFMLWFMTEILLTCTLVVWVLHYLIPSFIISDVRKLEQKMMSILSHSFASLSEQKAGDEGDRQIVEDSEFNMAEYLFVSRRIAKRIPTNPVARLILTFRTPWPRHSYKNIQDDGYSSNSYRNATLYALGNFLGVFAYGLRYFLQLPQGLQDGIVHATSSAATGYIVLGHEQLFGFYPALAFLPLFFFCLFIHYLIVRRQSIAQHPIQIVRSDAKVSRPVENRDSSTLTTTLDKVPNRRASLMQGIALIEDAHSRLDGSCRSIDHNDSIPSSNFDSPVDSDGQLSVNSFEYNHSISDLHDQRTIQQSIAMVEDVQCGLNDEDGFNDDSFDSSSDYDSPMNSDSNSSQYSSATYSDT